MRAFIDVTETLSIAEGMFSTHDESVNGAVEPTHGQDRDGSRKIASVSTTGHPFNNEASKVILSPAETCACGSPSATVASVSC